MTKPLQILCISPRFAPSNEADTHRLRLLLSHAAASGWNAVIVGVAADCLSVAQDPWLVANLPKNLEVHRIWIPQKRWFMTSVFIRAWTALDDKVRMLLSARKFDLIFFSTNEFPLTTLALGWKRDFGTPFCIDFQDPWVNDYYSKNRSIVPPGGRLKYAVMDRIHRLLESKVVPACDGLLAVSPAYLSALISRYGEKVSGKHMLVRPFPGEPDEVGCLTEIYGTSKSSKEVIWRYVGRGGLDMAKSASAFFAAWGQVVSEGKTALDSVRFEAIGTSYATDGAAKKSIEPLALGTAISARVEETPTRLGYSDALKKLAESDGLVVFGSDDPAYTASKIYPYLLAGKPLLAIFHEKSSVVELMREVGGGVCVTFNEETTPNELAQSILANWFRSDAWKRPVKLDRVRFEPYTARAQALELGKWFAEIIASIAGGRV